MTKVTKNLARAQRKYAKSQGAIKQAEAKTEQAQLKAAKWWGKMEKHLGTSTVAKLDNGKAVTGQKYADYYMNKYAKYKTKAAKKS